METPVTARAALLHVLTLSDQPRNGAELLADIGGLTRGKLVFSTAGIYRALAQMVADRLVTCEERSRRGRDARYHALTDKGREIASEYREIVRELFGV